MQATLADIFNLLLALLVMYSNISKFTKKCAAEKLLGSIYLSLAASAFLIRFEIIICLVIKRNLLNLSAKVELMKISTPQVKAQCVSWFIETKSDNVHKVQLLHSLGQKISREEKS